MIKKDAERILAIKLRTEGKTYREILEKVSVAKSTLSLWLRSVGLASPQTQRITQKRIEGQRKGAFSRRITRMKEVDDLMRQGTGEIGIINARELWLIGIALYWAEGSKQNTASVSAGVQFGNSDVRMLKIFLKWLYMLDIPLLEIRFSLYVHDNRKDESEKFCSWWAEQLGINRSKISGVYFKRDKPKTKRTNVGDLYHGLLRITVNSSTVLNRKISGWIVGIVQNCRLV